MKLPFLGRVDFDVWQEGEAIKEVVWGNRN